MGLFDTLVFKKTFTCEKCNTEINSTHTKQCGCTLSQYTEGDYLYGLDIISGVFKENLFCKECHHSEQYVYISVWHSLYAGTYDNYYEAEQRIISIEKTDLLDYILFQQKRYSDTAAVYNKFNGLMNLFLEYCTTEDKENFFNDKKITSFHRSALKDYVDSDNINEILKNILEKFNKTEELPDGRIFF